MAYLILIFLLSPKYQQFKPPVRQSKAADKAEFLPRTEIMHWWIAGVDPWGDNPSRDVATAEHAKMLKLRIILHDAYSWALLTMHNYNLSKLYLSCARV